MSSAIQNRPRSQNKRTSPAAALFLAMLLLGLITNACSVWSNPASNHTPTGPDQGSGAGSSAGQPWSGSADGPSPQESKSLPVEVYLPQAPQAVRSLPIPVDPARLEALLAAMTPAQKIGQVIITGLPGKTLSIETCQQIQRMQPAGVTFQWYNVEGPVELKQFVDALWECAGQAGAAPMLFTLAHEGEYVSRFAHTATTFPSALAVAATGRTEYAYSIGLASGLELAASGLNMVLGPVADVLLDLDSDVISQRSYGSDPALVSQYVEGITAGYRTAGIIPVLKHFPGHGGIASDSHRELPVDEVTRQELERFYLPPFVSGINAGAPVVMLSHIAYPALTGHTLPATVSTQIIDLLRRDLQFSGPVLSDHLKMRAMSGDVYSVAGASLAALQSGVDLLLLNEPEDAWQSYDYLLGAVQDGSLPAERLDDAVRRILALKLAWGVDLPPVSLPEPDYRAHQQLADEIGARAVATLRNSAGLIPIPPRYRQILVVGPSEEGFNFYQEQLIPALDAAGFRATLATLPLNDKGVEGSEELIGAIERQARRSSLLLVFSYQSHLWKLTFKDTWQIQLSSALEKTGKPIIFVALRSPTDLMEYPQASSVLATFGTTDSQLRTLIDILLGKAEAQGVNPLPALR